MFTSEGTGSELLGAVVFWEKLKNSGIELLRLGIRINIIR